MRKSFTYNRKTIKLEDENTRSEDINHDDVILENITDNDNFPTAWNFFRNDESKKQIFYLETCPRRSTRQSREFEFSHLRLFVDTLPTTRILNWMAKVTGDPMVAKRPDFQTKFRGVMDKVKRPPARSSSFIIITIFFDKRRLTYRHLHHEHHR